MEKRNVHIATYQDAAKPLAKDLPKQPVDVVVRLGGSMAYSGYAVQINSRQAILNSIDKSIQKQLLLNAGLQTLPLLQKPVYPCVVKGRVRSCGTKVFVCNTADELKAAKRKLNDDCLMEDLFQTTSEYRLHCTQDEVFFTVKKFKRNPADIIVRHDNHYNKREFLKPRLWKDIQKECLKAMKALGLDIGCFDVLYCSKDDNNHKFVIAEANTNPELLNNTYKAYEDILTRLIAQKVEAYKKNEEKPKIQEKQKEKLNDNQKYRVIQGVINDEYWISEGGEVLSIKL